MNGRCQNDALDRAEDICELCGDQYCAHCLLFPRGHRNPPTCKTCALENSGIRGGSTKRSPISRREYKKRKKELIEQLDAVEEKQPAIEYFELNDPSKFDQSTELDRRPASLPSDEPVVDILATNDAPTTPAPTPAPIPPAPTPPPPAAPMPADHSPVVPPEPQQLAPVDTSVNPLALGGSPATPTPQTTAAAPVASTPDASSTAAELLARLKADQPIQSQFSSAPAGLDIDPFATPTSDLVAGQAPTPGPASLTPAASAPPAADPAPTPTQGSGSWQPPAAPPRASILSGKIRDTADASVNPAESSPFADVADSPFADVAPASAPFADTPFVAPSQPSPSAARAAFIDAPLTSEPTPHASPAGDACEAPLSSLHTEAPVEPFDSPLATGGEGPDDEDQPRNRKADTDNSGQWIPPSLRGMESPDRRDPLPKRRS